MCNSKGGKQGQPKTVKGGRPEEQSPLGVIAHIKAIAPSQNKSHTNAAQMTAELTLSLCSHVLNKPMELTECEALVCAPCLCEWVRAENTLICPCCNKEHLGDFQTVRPATATHQILLTLHPIPSPVSQLTN